MSDPVPAGYVRVTSGRCSAVVVREHEADARALLADGTPYEAAARDLAARPLAGRGIVYAIALPVSHTRAVVRHNRHGGLLAAVTRDFFLAPTRAPHELETSLRLSAAGVPTPQVLMYAVETKAVVLRRSDVVTREIVDSCDLAAYMTPGVAASERAAAWAAARALVHALGAAGARHQDLNVKNILLAHEGGALRAWVLDVDRVTFTTPDAARAANGTRLLRSARKWRDERGAMFSDEELG